LGYFASQMSPAMLIEFKMVIGPEGIEIVNTFNSFENLRVNIDLSPGNERTQNGCAKLCGI
jgi:hypothetical protein